MPGYFYCRYCGKRTRKNPRIKNNNQNCCGSRRCQQSRKNLWEKKKLKNDVIYNAKRKSQKANWRKKRPVDKYQKEYRDSHPFYAESNRNRQRLRNKNASKIALENKNRKIVKTDALTSESPIREGLYEILPFTMRPGKKIVKTDTLIVEIRAHHMFPSFLVPQSD